MSEKLEKLKGKDLWGPGMPSREELEALKASACSEEWDLLQERREEFDMPLLTREELKEQSRRDDEEFSKLARKWGEPYWKGLPATLLDEVGIDYSGCPIVDGEILPPPTGQALTVPYLDEHGDLYVQLAYTREDGREFPAMPAVRRFVRDENGLWKPTWTRGYKASEGPPYLPFKLCPLHERPDYVLIVLEGESDTLAAGYAARNESVTVDVIGVPGADGWRTEWVEEYCVGRPFVYVAGDGDEAGRKLNAAAAKDLRAAGVETRVVPVGEGEDIRSMLESDAYLTWILNHAEEVADRIADEVAAAFSVPATQPGRDTSEPRPAARSPSARRSPAHRLDAQQTAEALGDAKRLPDGSSMARCPAHDDTRPSLHLTDSGDKVLVHCFAGCSQDAVIERLRELGLWGSDPDWRQAAIDPDYRPQPPASPGPKPETAAPSRVGQWWDEPPDRSKLEEKRPGILTRPDGATLLYLNALNTVYGLPGCGKTWVVTLAVIEVLKQGGRVIFWNWEDSIRTVNQRAQQLGALDLLEDTDSFRHVTSVNLEADGALEDAIRWLTERAREGKPTLIVIDTTGAAGCPQDGSDVYQWLAEHVTPWREAGITVLTVDHIPKRSKDRPAGPIGSQAKLATVDGAALRVTGTPWTRERDGTIFLIVEKDRHGELPAAVQQTAAVIKGTYDEHGAFGVTIKPPSRNEPPDREDKDGPNNVDRLLTAIDQAGPDGYKGKHKLRAELGLGADSLETLLQKAQTAGLITTRGKRPITVKLTDRGRERIQADSQQSLDS